MEKTNKQVIQDLKEYFLTQDPKIVAHILAGLLIDLTRLYNLHKLEQDERQNLFFRLDKNIEEIKKFIKNGPDSDLSFENLP